MDRTRDAAETAEMRHASGNFTEELTEELTEEQRNHSGPTETETETAAAVGAHSNAAVAAAEPLKGTLGFIGYSASKGVSLDPRQPLNALLQQLQRL